MGPEIEIAFYVTQQRRVWFTPDAAPSSHGLSGSDVAS
jgi:hypothetical protein